MYSNAIVRQFGVVSWPWKYLYTAAPQQTMELYNLTDDPQESVNLAGTERKVITGLEDSLVRWIALQQKYYSSGAYLHKAAPDYCPEPSATAQ